MGPNHKEGEKGEVNEAEKVGKGQIVQELVGQVRKFNHGLTAIEAT